MYVICHNHLGPYHIWDLQMVYVEDSLQIESMFQLSLIEMTSFLEDVAAIHVLANNTGGLDVCGDN